MNSNPEDIIKVNPPAEREQSRRRMELLAAVLLLVAVVGGTWAQLAWYGVDSWLFIALLNVNFILMLVILFLVSRNAVKLIMERRRKVFGARLRTRLVVVFVSLSLVPTVIMFLASNRVIITSVDYWFTNQTESSFQAALDVGRSFYAAAAERLEARSGIIVQEVVDRKLLWGGPVMSNLFVRKQKEYGLSVLGVVSGQGLMQNWHATTDFDAVWQEVRHRINWDHVAANQFGSLLWATEHADYVVGIYAVDGGKTGFLISAESIGQGLMSKLERIAKGFEDYTKLKQLKKPLKVSFSLILGVLGLVIVFGSVWFGFRLSKEMTAPMLALAEGTSRIAKGDLDFRLEDTGNDELALLVQSFNRMAKDLQQSRQGLTRANELLARQNATVAERNRYIEAVLDSVATGVVTLDAQGNLLTMNKAACTIFSADSRLLQGRRPIDFLPPQYGQTFAVMLQDLREKPDEHWVRHIDFVVGERTWKLIIHAVALIGEQGVQAYLAAIEDVTELEKMQRMAAWREVARRIAHEIKNPLTPIKLSAQRLEKRYAAQIEDPVFRQCTELIVRQVERMQEMVQEFSAFAKLPEVHLRKGDVTALLEELVSLFRNSHSRISWKLEIPQALPPVTFDSAALHRALLNICTNAAEALEEACARKEYCEVIVKAYVPEEQHGLRISIQDNGPGLNAAERERIFEPYYSGKHGGTGLGLAIVKSIITDHMGTIRVTAAAQKGTVFIIELPMDRMLHSQTQTKRAQTENDDEIPVA